MDRPTLIRRLRIAASVFCAVVAVALCVLWVRSYWRRDHVQGPWRDSGTINFWSSPGQLTIGTVRKPSSSWHLKTLKYPDAWLPPPVRWGWGGNALGTTVYFPQRVLVVVFALLSAAPWIRPRFSLRDLLIATTLVAVVLGLEVWAAG